MIKNGPKVLFAAICFCVLLCIVYLTIQSCGDDLPDHPIKQPLTVDLNTADAETFSQIPGMSASLAQSIVAYRESYGNYVDVEELLDIKGMSRELYDEIKQYISIGGSQ